MNPALSIILFSTLSGAGLGLGAVASIWGILLGDRPFNGNVGTLAAVAAAFAVSGLMASVFHLRRPWRSRFALSQWRSSWLSREGILAPLAVCILLALVIAGYSHPRAVTALSVAALTLCPLAVFATSMIYAQLRAVPGWHTAWTPILYLGFAISSGAALAVAATIIYFISALFMLSEVDNANVQMTLVHVILPPREFLFGTIRIAVGATAAAWIVNAIWWFRLDRKGMGASSAESATGLGRFGRVRLLESPHAGSNYLMKEMGYAVARRHAVKLRVLALLIGCVLPIALLLGNQITPLLPMIAFLPLLVGIGISRWLFFAEAKHAVSLYY